MEHWTSQKIRQQFLDFFESKEHKIVSSAPLVLKNDSSLLFTNAGMNQFKDIFLNNKSADSLRVADTQKCLRVSGKHNDLEEVGIDTYHHTMFEMLGNWSFGDYFKKEAISWAWELLTEVYGIEKDRLYVTVFEGDKEDGLERDDEAEQIWKSFIAEDRIIDGNKSDNFWEMGETGPSGPCSEIHVDIRSDEERNAVDGRTLVNMDHPLVVEIWNLVFIQYNRKADKSLESLPQQHIDTGMGFERLCMVLQGVKSNYDTDVFRPLIAKIEELSGIRYGSNDKSDVAMRVIADHIRALSFAIADGQLPSNTGAGYVIRRILRRAIRYGYSFLGFQQPFFFELVQPLTDQLGHQFPELKQQQLLVTKVIEEEENSFLNTLASGLKRLDTIKTTDNIVSGTDAFELYDTYGFPLDLTKLIASEKGWQVDEAAYKTAMTAQREQSRSAQKTEVADWIDVHPSGEFEFVGYNALVSPAKIVKYRTVKQNDKNVYQLVLNKSPFYAESGGQVGDKGVLDFGDEEIQIYDTKKENESFIHFANKLPTKPDQPFTANVYSAHRLPVTRNHSATHLLHAALREVLGKHVEQKGSLVAAEKFRFDFSHFSKLTDEEIQKVEKIVNEKILENISRQEELLGFDEAVSKGAMALFGEKYGDQVRVITFDPNFSVELCGGIHVASSGEIGLFKITGESAIAAGVRRIEAITGEQAKTFYDNRLNQLSEIGDLVKNNNDTVKAVQQLLKENDELKQKLAGMSKAEGKEVKAGLLQRIESHDGIHAVVEQVELQSSDAMKDLAFELRNEVDNLFLVLGAAIDGKAILHVMLSESVIERHELDAGVVVRQLAKHIQGGGGGQKFYATAGGKNTDGISAAIAEAKEILAQLKTD